jgi:hypothetical protein
MPTITPAEPILTLEEAAEYLRVSKAHLSNVINGKVPDVRPPRVFLWRRNMRPAPEAIGMEWATFQVLRKTNASLSKKAGVDPKVASDQRGHGLGVSLEVYTSSDLEQKRAALRALEAAVRQKESKPQPQPSAWRKSA